MFHLTKLRFRRLYFYKFTKTVYNKWKNKNSHIFVMQTFYWNINSFNSSFWIKYRTYFVLDISYRHMKNNPFLFIYTYFYILFFCISAHLKWIKKQSIMSNICTIIYFIYHWKHWKFFMVMKDFPLKGITHRFTNFTYFIRKLDSWEIFYY